MDLSIVIPAFEESMKIARDIKAASIFLKGNRFQGEILVVDDGSKDNTAEVARSVHVPKDIACRVIRYEPHRGKGCAVRTGMLETTGRFTMFADCGLCIPYGNALQGLQMLQADECDIAHGSRRMIESDVLRDQPLRRRICSRLFKWTVKKYLGIPKKLTDTQCGFKLYKGDVAREIYGESASDGFMFDIETILLALHRGYRIEEFPVEWACDPDSRLSLTKTPMPVFSELRAIRRKLGTKRPTR